MGCSGGCFKKPEEITDKPETIRTNNSMVITETSQFEEDRDRVKGKPYKTKPTKFIEGNLVKLIFYGVLADNAPFEDCLITSNEELEANLIKHISPTLFDVSIKKVQTSPKRRDSRASINFYANTEDEFLNSDNNFDFKENHIIAISGAYIEKVLVKNDTYKVFTYDRIVASNEYCAVLINIPKENPKSWEFAHWTRVSRDEMLKLDLGEAFNKDIYK